MPSLMNREIDGEESKEAVREAISALYIFEGKEVECEDVMIISV